MMTNIIEWVVAFGVVAFGVIGFVVLAAVMCPDSLYIRVGKLELGTKPEEAYEES